MISSLPPPPTTLETYYKHTDAPSLTAAIFSMEFTILIALFSFLCLILFIYTLSYGLRLWNTKTKHSEDIEAIQARKHMEY